MITVREAGILGMCLEGFFYGLYSGIFAIYLYWASKNSESRTPIISCALWVLYALSTVSVVSDLAGYIIVDWSDFKFQLMISIVETTASGCCDFLAQCILIYRCWIVWGKNIRVVIIPSFLAIAYLAIWIAPDGALSQTASDTWGNTLTILSFALSMVVNTLVTGLIVFRIHKVFLQVRRTQTSVERTLGSTKDTTLRHIMFVIIESGMALLAIQLVRIIIGNVPSSTNLSTNSLIAFELIVGIHEMFNGITPTIILVRVAMRLSFDDPESLMEVAESLCFNNPPSDPNSTLQWEVVVPQERSEPQ